MGKRRACSRLLGVPQDSYLAKQPLPRNELRAVKVRDRFVEQSLGGAEPDFGRNAANGRRDWRNDDRMQVSYDCSPRHDMDRPNLVTSKIG